jgi:titin
MLTGPDVAPDIVARNTIGGSTPEARNVISGHNTVGHVQGRGVYLAPNDTTANNLVSINNEVVGNLIGTDKTGTVAIPNDIGVQFHGSNGTLGGATPAHRNVISGNVHQGVIVGSESNSALGNFVGTDVTGRVALANGTGILVVGQNSVIGGSDPGAGNLVSGNLGAGIIASAPYEGDVTRIEGNLVGTDVDGLVSLGNQHTGIELGAVQLGAITVGGAAAGARNVISGHSLYGIVISGNNNTIQGNHPGQLHRREQRRHGSRRQLREWRLPSNRECD